MSVIPALSLAAAILAAGASNPAFAGAPDGGQETPLADPRLSDPEAFGRFADVARSNADGAFVPVSPVPGGRRRPALSQTGFPARSAPTPVPSPNAGLKSPARRSPPLHLPRLPGAAALTLGALFLAVAARPRPNALAPKATLSFPKETPLLRLEDKRRQQPAVYSLWTPPPTPLRIPAAPPEAFAPRPTWRAISDAEMTAIDRWDAAKEAEGRTLDGWLDAHAGELGGVDVPRLRAKLRRDA